MRTIRIIFYSLPWMLILILLITWYLGFEFPGKGQSNYVEVVNSTVLLEKIEELGKLELVRYNYREIFDYKALSEGKVKGSTVLKLYDYSPDIKAVLIASGEAVGCIDLRKIRDQDIYIKEDSILLHLPDPELCYYKLDMEQTRIYDFERSGWWSRLFSGDEEMQSVIEKAYREAERQIRISALEGGILEETKTNAEKLLGPMFRELTGKTIVFSYKPAPQSLSPENE